MKKWLPDEVAIHVPAAAIGSGGNINKIFSISRKKPGKALSLEKLEKIEHNLRSYTWKERITVLGFRPDRADVILPAIKIFKRVMVWAGIWKIYVPQIGFSDGLIHVLFERQQTARAGGREGPAPAPVSREDQWGERNDV
jgi:exopolyphosphatase/guanosine-5'-triphosphate,3'-diphosphate pyrophosphatase